MMFDMPLNQLKKYRPERNEPSDFDEFWKNTILETKKIANDPIFKLIDCGIKLIDVYDVTFSGYDGQKIKGWLHIPKNIEGPLSCVVEYVGYGGGRGFPFENTLYALCGYAHFIMDTRGQGSVWRSGHTADPESDGANPHFPGFMTKGVLDPKTYYYRRVFADAVMSIEAVRQFEKVDENKIVVTGGSQGGGICLAITGLVDDIFAAMIDVPFLTHYRHATEITDSAPYSEISKFCKIHRDKIEQVFSTLHYFDGINFAVRAKCPALFSVGLMDDICPPSTVYAAYNYYNAEKQIKVWPYNNHEGGEAFQDAEKIKYLQSLDI